MKLTRILLIILLSGSLYQMFAQGPQNKNFGFGIVLGEPTGATIKYWPNRVNALVAYIGSSYFGSPRIGADYLWHFEAFDSDIVELYAGPGAAIGFGDSKSVWYEGKNGKFYVREGNDIGLGVRGMFGLNVIPRDVPIETYLEIGVLLGIAPDFGSAADVAIGIRFYP